jgi:monoamine oxidase
MARSNLLRSIIRIARQFQGAHRAGIPVDAVPERVAAARENAGMFTRRQYLANIGAAAAGLALSSKVTANALTQQQPRIAIIGAGVSGLNCALTLADHGLRSTVYEANARIGGRMFSNNGGYWDDKQVTEWCGELIDTNHETIQGLASRFGLALDDLTAAEDPRSEDTYFFDGNYYRRSQAILDFAPVFAAVQADAEAADYPTTYNTSTRAGRKLDEMSVWEWIQKRVPGGHNSKMGQLLDVAYAIEYGADTRKQSSLNLVYLLSGSDEDFEIFGESDERYHVHGGNELIPRSIAQYLESLGTPVQTGKRLTAIRRRPDGAYRLNFETTGGRNEIVADLVVLTLPFAVLRTLDYGGAGFDALKHKAIEELGRGQNGKLQLQFNSRVWTQGGPWGRSNGSSYADTGYQITWEPTRGQSGQRGILNDYTGGNVAERMNSKVPFAFGGNPDVQRDASRFLKQIYGVFPGLPSLWNGKVTSSLPHLSPSFNCSYSFWRVGQYHTIAGYEAVRQRNVFFAGEHTSIDFQGFMEGAAVEGARAAGEILTQFGVAAATLPLQIGRV